MRRLSPSHCLLLALLAGPAQCATESDPAASFLEFSAESDGRCQILSEGGQLRILRNRHSERAIDYRLMRVFANGRPQNRVVGTAPPGGEPVKLGCTRVDGRPQDWLLERATFTP